MMKKTLALVLSLSISSLSFGDITSNLIGWWKLDEGSGTNAADSSGSSNDGTLNGTSLPSWITGKIGTNALNFAQHATNRVDIPAQASNNFGDAITVATWLRVTNGQTLTNQPIISKWGTANNWWFGWGYAFNDSNTVYLGIRYSTCDGTAIVESTTTLNDGNWHHVVGVWNTTLAYPKIYVDGAENTTGTYNHGSEPTGMCSPNTDPIVLGNNNSYNNPENGDIDEVRVYHRALSASDVLELYNYTGAGGGTPAPPDSTRRVIITGD